MKYEYKNRAVFSTKIRLNALAKFDWRISKIIALEIRVGETTKRFKEKY